MIGEALKHALTGEAMQKATVSTFIVAGVASLILAGYSLALPHTPPKKTGEGAARESLPGLSALKLLKHPFMLVLWLVTPGGRFRFTTLISAWAGQFLGTKVSDGGAGIPSNWISPVMSVG